MEQPQKLPVLQSIAASILPIAIAVCYGIFGVLAATLGALGRLISGHSEEIPSIWALSLFLVVVAVAIVWLQGSLKKALMEGSTNARRLWIWTYGVMAVPFVLPLIIEGLNSISL